MSPTLMNQVNIGSEHATASKMDAVASATRELDAAASNSNAAASTRLENCLCISTCQNFEKSPFNIGKNILR